MENICRTLTPAILTVLARGKSVLLLGPRQVGKTTLINQLKLDLNISLARPGVRQQYERDIESFSQEVESLARELSKTPLIAVDEVQKIPELMDAIQDLIDRKVAQFILTGSSARKLRLQQQLNWLPGRVVYFHLDPLTINELPTNYLDINEILHYGTLPGIVTDTNNNDREQDLESYVTTYLEEEIRQEALVRKLGDFSKFLELAALESGHIINCNRIAQDIGIAQTTISSYYQILEDCLIAERIEPYLANNNTRRRLVKSPRYLFFDLGIRRIAAHEGKQSHKKMLEHWFEQFIGLELLRQTRSISSKVKLNFWRDLEGREVDWVLNTAQTVIPIEVKWTDTPSVKDTRYLKVFLSEYNLDHGYLVCRIKRPRQLDAMITAIPWQELNLITSKFHEV